MAEFSTTAALEIEVDQRSLRSARKEIESNAGSVSMGVDSPSPLRADGGGLSNFNRNKASRERAMSRQLLTSQVELLDDIKDEIEKAGVSGGGGGGGGGGGSGLGGTVLQALGVRSALGGLGGLAGGGMMAGLLGGGVGMAGLMAGGPLALATGALHWGQQNTDNVMTREEAQARRENSTLPGGVMNMTNGTWRMTPEERAEARSNRTVRGGQHDRSRNSMTFNITTEMRVDAIETLEERLERLKRELLKQVEDEMVQPGDQFAGGHVR